MKFLTKEVNVTLGCDPEVFFLNTDNSVASAVGLVGGSKEHPRICDGGALQEDNIMAEFNTDPVTSVEDFLININKVYSQVSSIAKANGLSVGVQASRSLSPFILDTVIEAKEFGCDPDFNAYTLRANKTPDPDSALRTCAGHIHVGYDVEGGHSLFKSGRFAKYMDAYVGLWCVLMDEDTRRMSRYGKAGAFRPKPYGTEYRVPSNFWLKSTKSTTEVFNRSKEAYRAAYKGLRVPKEVAMIINTQNKAKAEEVLCKLTR